ncbi:hypothetical protein D3C76_1297170 [compost metagenome]
MFLPLQFFEQIDDLSLNGYIESGNRLIANDELWLNGQRTGNPDPLPLASGQFMGITISMFRIQADCFQQFCDLKLAVFGVCGKPMHINAFGNNFSDLDAGIQ